MKVKTNFPVKSLSGKNPGENDVVYYERNGETIARPWYSPTISSSGGLSIGKTIIQQCANLYNNLETSSVQQWADFAHDLRMKYSEYQSISSPWLAFYMINFFRLSADLLPIETPPPMRERRCILSTHLYVTEGLQHDCVLNAHIVPTDSETIQMFVKIGTLSRGYLRAYRASSMRAISGLNQYSFAYSQIDSDHEYFTFGNTDPAITAGKYTWLIFRLCDEAGFVWPEQKTNLITEEVSEMFALGQLSQTINAVSAIGMGSLAITSPGTGIGGGDGEISINSNSQEITVDAERADIRFDIPFLPGSVIDRVGISCKCTTNALIDIYLQRCEIDDSSASQSTLYSTEVEWLFPTDEFRQIQLSFDSVTLEQFWAYSVRVEIHDLTAPGCSIKAFNIRTLKRTL